MITADELRECMRYEPDTGRFYWRKYCGPRALPGNEAGSLNPTGYIKITIRGIQYPRSKLAWLYTYSKWPTPFIDHINRERSDDRIINLRQATRGQNNRNTKMRSNNTTGVKGVIVNRGKFMVRINIRGKSIYIGRYDDLDDASQAYQIAATKYHGSFAS